MVSIQHEERKMGALRSLTFTTIPKIVANPTLDRRTNMIARLEEQKLLLNDPNYIRTTRTWVKTNGKLTPIDRQHRILPWWRVNPDGSYVLTSNSRRGRSRPLPPGPPTREIKASDEDRSLWLLRTMREY